MKARALYDDLLSTGDLFEMYEDMTGNWKEDKNKFIYQQKSLEEFSKNIKTNDAEFID